MPVLVDGRPATALRIENGEMALTDVLPKSAAQWNALTAFSGDRHMVLWQGKKRREASLSVQSGKVAIALQGRQGEALVRFDSLDRLEARTSEMPVSSPPDSSPLVVELGGEPWTVTDTEFSKRPSAGWRSLHTGQNDRKSGHATTLRALLEPRATLSNITTVELAVAGGDPRAVDVAEQPLELTVIRRRDGSTSVKAFDESGAVRWRVHRVTSIKVGLREPTGGSAP